jgi:hypothetical protein
VHGFVLSGLRTILAVLAASAQMDKREICQTLGLRAIGRRDV